MNAQFQSNFGSICVDERRRMSITLNMSVPSIPLLKGSTVKHVKMTDWKRMVLYWQRRRQSSRQSATLFCFTATWEGGQRGHIRTHRCKKTHTGVYAHRPAHTCVNEHTLTHPSPLAPAHTHTQTLAQSAAGKVPAHHSAAIFQCLAQGEAHWHFMKHSAEISSL